MRDKLLLFGDGMDAVGVAADYDSTNILNLAKIDKGEGSPLWWVTQFDEDWAGGTSVQFGILDSATVGGTYVEKLLTEVTLLAASLAGKRFKIALPYDTNKFLYAIARTLGTHTGSAEWSSWLEID